MFQYAGNDDDAFFEVAAPPTYSSMEREASKRATKASNESAELSDIPIDQPMPDEGLDTLTIFNISAPVHPIGNSVKNVVQLVTEAKTEAICQEEIQRICLINNGEGGTMHVLKKEQAAEGLQDSAVQATTFPSFSPIETKGNASAADSETVKRETKSKFVPSITTPTFQATVLERETSPEEAIVILTGAIEQEQVLPLDNFLNSVIQKNTNRLFCDVGGLLSINSSGWGILVSQMQRLRKRGGELSLCSLQGEIERSFKILDLYKLFPTFRTVSEALRKTVSEPDDTRPFLPKKDQPGQSQDAPASVSLEEKIHRIVLQDPSLGVTGIHKLLKTKAYGTTSISLWKLISTLNSMALGSKELRYRYFRSS
jgi:anti-anti-sigma factor